MELDLPVEQIIMLFGDLLPNNLGTTDASVIRKRTTEIFELLIIMY
jgi:hypothetical protein